MNQKLIKPNDQKWIDIVWGMTNVQDLYDELKPALASFGLKTLEIDIASDGCDWYVYEGPTSKGEEIANAIDSYWEEHEDMHNRDEDFGLGFSWGRIVTDWKLDGGMIPQFQEAAALFGVHIYILPDEYAQERLLLTKADLSHEQVLRLESDYYDEEKLKQLQARIEQWRKETDEYFRKLQEEPRERTYLDDHNDAMKKKKDDFIDLRKKYQAYVELESGPFQCRSRLRQSMWREEQGYPIGEYSSKGETKSMGSLLAMPWAEETLNNYLNDLIRDVIRAEVLDKEKSKGKLFGKPRIFNNLLSSQPLCFNLFGELQQDLFLATKVINELVPGGVKEVTAIEFEYSPGRGDERYTGDRSAFDVYVLYTTVKDGKGFLGIEVKYHEDLRGDDAPLRERYDEIAKIMGCFDLDDLDDVKLGPCQQIWRDHLLAWIHKDVDGFDEGTFVFLCPKDNQGCAYPMEYYGNKLTNTESILSWTLEDVVDVIKKHTSEEWIDVFWDRYLNFNKIDSLLAEQ